MADIPWQYVEIQRWSKKEVSVKIHMKTRESGIVEKFDIKPEEFDTTATVFKKIVDKITEIYEKNLYKF